MSWSVEPVNDAVEAELLALPADMQARYLWIVDLLRVHGPQQVTMPYVRHLEGKLWEMRLSGRSGIARAIYTAASGRRLAVLCVFIKKSEKTPRRAIETALRRAKELQG